MNQFSVNYDQVINRLTQQMATLIKENILLSEALSSLQKEQKEQKDKIQQNATQ